MDPTTISVLSACAAAIWSVWTWQSETQKERELKRDQMSAEYVNTFILVTQELQKKLFRVLECDDLAHLQQGDTRPGQSVSQAALDILYHLNLFFGWALVTFRYGPYTRDAEMIAIFAKIDEVLDSRDRFSGDAFRFTLSDRLALGSVAVRQIEESSSKPAFVSIPQFKFEEDFLNEGSEHARLYRTEGVRCTVEAVDRAVAGAPLDGRERLGLFQNILIDLLAYLEHQEGFRTAYGKRGKAKVPNFSQEIVTARTMDVHMVHRIPGRVRLGIPPLHEDGAFGAELKSFLHSLNYIKSVRVNPYASCAVIEYSSEVTENEFLQAVITRVKEHLSRTVPPASRASSKGADKENAAAGRGFRPRST
jgi:hypothetical protein